MRWVILGFLFLLSVLNYTDKSVLGLAAQSIISDLDLTYNQFGLLGSAFFIAYAVGGIVIGILTYRVNSKYLLITIALGWTVSLIPAYFVENLTQLMIIRIILGFFEGGSYAICVVHLARWFKSSERGVTSAIMTSGTIVGAYVAAPILVLGISNIGWRYTFALLGIASLLWALCFVFMRSDPKKPLIEEVPIHDAGDEVLFKDVLKVFLNPYVASTLVLSFVAMWVSSWTITWAPTYLIEIVGLTPQNMSFIFAFIGIVGGIFAIIMGKFTDSLFKRSKSLIKSYNRVLIVILTVGATAFVLITLVQSPILACILLGVALVMNACLLPLNTAIKTMVIPKNLVGSVLGIAMPISSMAGVISPWFTGYFVHLFEDNIRHGFNYGVLIIVVLYLIASIILFVIRYLKFPSKKGASSTLNFEAVNNISNIKQ